MKKITVQIEDDVHKAFRLKAFKRGESLSEVLKKAIHSYVEGKEKPKPTLKPNVPTEVMTPVSKPQLVDYKDRDPNKKYVLVGSIGKYREVEA